LYQPLGVLGGLLDVFQGRLLSAASTASHGRTMWIIRLERQFRQSLYKGNHKLVTSAAKTNSDDVMRYLDGLRQSTSSELRGAHGRTATPTYAKESVDQSDEARPYR
jgi:hypothetical protein